MAGLWIAGGVGFTCVLGGILAIYRNALSPSEVGLLGSKLTTEHVGVAFVFIGVLVLGVVIRKAYRTVVQLGEIRDGTNTLTSAKLVNTRRGISVKITTPDSTI